METCYRLEVCVREILKMTTELAGPDRSFTHPAEALNFLGEQHLLDSTSCYDPDTEDITKLLRHQVGN